ncbi:MAG: sigma-70 family RNA polymerase sigma factor [Alphaproteobacteria bacterium]|nr:sigma-70 family RNA polymerase sigma factor [Alphaproteobacteria bacterium]
MSDLEKKAVGNTFLSDQEFKEKLAAAIPQLRAFARSLSRNVDLADDLVQETMLKAWSARGRFDAGTNFKAWSFTILRNSFYSITRRYRFQGEWDDLAAERASAAPPSQDMHMQLNDVLRALQQLPVAQREALVLVAAAGLPYEEVAEICGVAIGTVKSRVTRARTALKEIYDGGFITLKRADAGGSSEPIISLMDYAAQIQARVMAFQSDMLAA